ncbi:MAG: COQ9 family protein [Micavibrio aeruginosavorus]|uniref:COQ9 family protein n=1 Tax=Micavibrio aeruginosavorus TaxID=349221 RepID=A0A2W5MSB0_9BACT|nr:MAG: COQ9 family protein [Micavibrio aeruginosavorus]
MRKSNQVAKDAILEAALPSVPFDGWTMKTLEDAALTAGYPASMVPSVFPAGVKDALIHFSDWADRRMMDVLQTGSIPLRVRDRIALAVRTRFESLAPFREAERLAIAFWVRPFRKWEGARLVWKTADVIWKWAGDTATDYNRYTKRGLLSGVLTATALVWLSDTSKGSQDSWAFLERRIENIMDVGKIVAKVKKA